MTHILRANNETVSTALGNTGDVHIKEKMERISLNSNQFWGFTAINIDLSCSITCTKIGANNRTLYQLYKNWTPNV